jgi:thiol-disulfide isomerase/thioredoxin
MKSKSTRRHSSRQLGGSEEDGSSMTNIVVLLGMALVLVLIYYYIYMDNQMLHVESFTADQLDVKSDEVVLGLFYADWCPHCVRFKPEWEAMKSNINNSKTRSGKKVRMVNVNCETNKAMATKYGIDGYPTIKVITLDSKSKKEIVDDYDGQRTEDALKQFLKSL